MKKITTALLAGIFAGLSTLTACGGNGGGSVSGETSSAASTADANQENSSGAAVGSSGIGGSPIHVVSREEGSGTRGAFVELFGVEQKDADGNKVDHTTVEAMNTNSTAVMMTTVSGDVDAIGYISLGSLNDTVKAVKIDGAEPSVENIKNGTYKIARPFNVVTFGETSELAQDFLTFIMSGDGQKIVEDNGYIGVSGNEGYRGGGFSGKITVGGSSSVNPIMEKLKEGYAVWNPDVTVEIQQSDSTIGVSSVIEGVCDIGMASRELKESEIERGASGSAIAMDGIAVIVNNNNPVEEMTSEQVRKIFTGETTVWE